MSPIIKCRRCGHERPHKAKGLCQTCYNGLRKKKRDLFNAELKEVLKNEGLYTTHQDVADLGYAENPSSLARRLRRLVKRVDAYTHLMEGVKDE